MGANDRPSRPTDYAHRLHPSHPRRASDTSIERLGQNTSKAKNAPAAYSPVDRRPPPSTRGFHAIPPVPALPPMQLGALPGALDITPATLESSAASIASNPSTAHMSLSSVTTAVSSRPTSAPLNYLAPVSGPTTPSTKFVPEPTFDARPSSNSHSFRHKDRRTSKLTKFTELETIESTINEQMPYERDATRTDKITREISNDEVNAALSRQLSQTQTTVPAQPQGKTSKKLSKQPGAKLVKKSGKNRFSLKGSQPSAVAT
jgi:hypothetical protein